MSYKIKWDGKKIGQHEADISSKNFSEALKGVMDSSLFDFSTVVETTNTGENDNRQSKLTRNRQAIRISKKKSTCIPTRYSLALLSFIGFFITFTIRINNHLILSPTSGKHQDIITLNSSNASFTCPELFDQSDLSRNVSEINVQIDKNDTSNNIRNTRIVDTFYYAYAVSQVPSGLLADRDCAKLLFGLSILFTSIISLIIPLARRWETWMILLLSAVEGLAEGVTYPAMNALIARWSPKLERSRLSSAIYSGAPLGAALSIMVTPFSISSATSAGFYCYGIIGCVFFVCWMLSIYEYPHLHPRISKVESLLIRQDQIKRLQRRATIPFKLIFSSVPVWALILTHFASQWCFYTVLLKVPVYLQNVMHFSNTKISLLMSISFFSQALVASMSGVLADKLRTSAGLQITTVRKIMNSIATIVPGICFLLLACTKCNSEIAIALIFVAACAHGCLYSGFNAAHVEMCSIFSGTLMGITSCCANISGIILPLIVEWLTHNEHSLEQWKIVFLISAAITSIGGIIFGVLGTCEPQDWITNPQAPTDDTTRQEQSIASDSSLHTTSL